MSFWGKLFGTEKVIDGAIKGIDKAFYTDEEKAENGIVVMGIKEKLLKAYEPYKLAQRFLAMIVTIPYVIVWLVSAGFYAYGMTLENPETIKRMLEASKGLGEMNNDNLGTPFAIVLGWYFTGGVIEGSIRAFKGK